MKRQRGRCHTLSPPARSPTAPAPPPRPYGPSCPSRLPAGGAHLFAYFYLCSLPAANQRAGRGGGGGWEGLGLRLQLRRPQVPERVRVAAGAQRTAAPAQGPPPRLRPGPRGKDKEAVPEAPPEPRLPELAGTTGSKMVCGGFACSKNCLCALNLLYTVSTRSPFLPSRGLCTCSVAPWFSCLTSDSDFIPHPFPVFPRSARPWPPYQCPPETWSRRLSQSLPFPHCEAVVFLAHWPRLCHIALPRPLTHRLVFQSFDQTFPLSHRYPF